MRFILPIITLTLLVEYSWQYCSIHVLTVDATECTRNGTTIAIGGSMKLPQVCEDCSCNANSGPKGEVTMGCCAYGIHAGVMLPPPGCKIIADTDGCTAKLVNENDESKPC